MKIVLNAVILNPPLILSLPKMSFKMFQLETVSFQVCQIAHSLLKQLYVI